MRVVREYLDTFREVLTKETFTNILKAIVNILATIYAFLLLLLFPLAISMLIATLISLGISFLFHAPGVASVVFKLIISIGTFGGVLIFGAPRDEPNTWGRISTEVAIIAYVLGVIALWMY